MTLVIVYILRVSILVLNSVLVRMIFMAAVPSMHEKMAAHHQGKKAIRYSLPFILIN